MKEDIEQIITWLQDFDERGLQALDEMEREANDLQAEVRRRMVATAFEIGRYVGQRTADYQESPY